MILKPVVSLPLLMALCAATFSFAQTSACTPPPNAERDVRALEQKWLSAGADAGAVAPILADDFQHVLPQGIIDKAEHLGFLRQHPHSASAQRRFERMDVRVYGTAAVATGVVSAVRDGRPQRTRFTDVFAYRDGQWQAVSAQELPATDDSH